jgi:hypothetical protein
MAESILSRIELSSWRLPIVWQPCQFFCLAVNQSGQVLQIGKHAVVLITAIVRTPNPSSCTYQVVIIHLPHTQMKLVHFFFLLLHGSIKKLFLFLFLRTA